MNIISNSKVGVFEDPHAACPFIGVLDDEKTHFSYPSLGNFCYAALPLKSPAFERQADFCLSANHTACPVFLRRQAEQAQGKAGLVREKRYVRRAGRGIYYRYLALVLSVMALMAMVLVAYPRLKDRFSQEPPLLGVAAHVGITQTAWAAGYFSPTPSATETTTPTATTLPPAPVSTQPGASSQSAAPTQPAVPTQTASPPPPTPTRLRLTATPAQPTPGPEMETPFGPDQAFVLHTIEVGESLWKLAQMYDTSPAMLQAANVLPSGAKIWPGEVIVILPGQKDPEGVPRFQVVQLVADTHIDDLAHEYGIPVETVRQYNALGPGEWIPAGRWLILPYANTLPSG
jgi:LysM repeat protein